MHFFTDGSESSGEWGDGVYGEIEELIGYVFKNKTLLRQAFTRRSFARGKGYDSEAHNELLEFIGDKVLDFFAVKYLSEKFGEFTGKNGVFYSIYTEGVFTEFKKRLVEGKMLAWRIELLGLNKYLIVDKEEERELLKAKEDLFEAILGAVAIDCGWNMAKLSVVLDNLHDFEFYCTRGFGDYKNVVGVVERWAMEKFSELPEYTYSIDDIAGAIVCVLSFTGWDKTFRGYGDSQYTARLDASKKAREYFEINGLFPDLSEAVGKPDWDRSVNQLQELWQKGFIFEPEYEEIHSYDENGNSVWGFACRVNGYETCFGDTDSKKKDAKKNAAYEMLLKIFEQYGEDWDNYIPDPFDFDDDDDNGGI